MACMRIRTFMLEWDHGKKADIFIFAQLLCKMYVTINSWSVIEKRY